MSSDSSINCLFCNQPSRYTCPNCGIRYCSATCYKHAKHEQCSEAFYKDQVMKELKEMKASPEEKQKMIKTLLNESDCGRKYNIKDLEARLAGLDLEDFDSIWENLTSDEREMFENRVKSGNMNFIEIWEPWWSKKHKIAADTRKHSNKGKHWYDTSWQSSVLYLSRTKSTVKSTNTKDIPKLPKNITPFSSLSSNKPPQVVLKYSVIELLLTYVCLKRVFNGDLYDSPNDTTEELFYLSQVLNDNRIYSDVDVCTVSFIDNVNIRKQLEVDALFTCTEDLVLILSSKEQFIARSLSDLHTFIKNFYKYIKTEDAKLSEKLYKTSKKVYFLMSYSIAYEHEVKNLLSEVLSVKSRMEMEKEMYTSTRDQIEKNLEKLKPKPKLIKEL